MISRITKVIFLFALVGFSTITFENVTLKSSLSNLTNETNVTTDNMIDMEIFSALLYLLVMLGFAIIILVLIVNQTHLNLIEGFPKSRNSFYQNS